MGAIISDLKIQVIIHKFVPINFLDAKNDSQSNKTRFFVFCVPKKRMNGLIKIRFFLTLWCLEQKMGASKAILLWETLFNITRQNGVYI